MEWRKHGERLYYGLGIAYYVYHWIGIVSAVSIAVPYAFAITFPYAIPIYVVGIAGFGGSVVLSVRRRRQRRDALNPLVDIVSAIDTYTIPASGPYHFCREFVVRARQDGVQYFQCKFKWSASGQVELAVTPDDVVVLQKQFRCDDAYDLAILRLPRPLKRGEEQSFSLSWTLTAAGDPPRPFLSKLIDEFYPKGFTMVVNLPRAPTSSRKDIIRSMRNDIPVETIPTSEGRGTSLTWTERYPRFGAKYKISWSL